jgi:PKD repeat protein
VTYFWNFGDNTTALGASPSHVFATPGTYTVTLTVISLTGLTATATSKATITTATGYNVGLTGLVASGSQPIVGAHVYLLAANTTGYGGNGIAASSSNKSVSLVSAAETGTSDSVGAYVLTGSNGGFSLTGDYTCSSGQQLYLYALGGNAGSGTNAAIGLMAALGNCPASGSSAISVTVNEVTTIGASYAFAGFATDATHVSSSGTALAQVGIANAFASATNLATLSTGTALATTPAGFGAVPQGEINLLANILAACVNAPSSCSPVLSTATADGTTTGTKPSDTATAAINIAHNPGSNIAALYGMASSAVFTPKLNFQPNDFTVAITYSNVVNYPTSIAIDSAGNVWAADWGSGSVTKLSNLGFLVSNSPYSGGGINAPNGIAIDNSGNAWTANSGGNSITELSSAGAFLSGTNGYSGGGLNDPEGVAVDGSGHVWATTSNSVVELASTGSFLSGAGGYVGGGLFDPLDIAIDGSGNAWTADFQAGITKISPAGSTQAISVTTGLYDFDGIAVDSSGNVWAAAANSNSERGSVLKLSSSGAILSGADGYTGGGVNIPDGVAIDGAGNAWVTNGVGGSVTELSSSGVAVSGANGFSSLFQPTCVAVDGSGNIWIGERGTYPVVTELIGAGTPVITPIAAGLPTTPTANGSSNLGTRP